MTELYTEEKIHEIVNRENVGVGSINPESEDSTVILLDGLLRNGIHVYMPYGIVVQVQESLSSSIDLHRKEIDKTKAIINEICNGRKIEEISGIATIHTIESLQFSIKKIEGKIIVLDELLKSILEV